MRLFCFGPSMALTPSGQLKLTKIAPGDFVYLVIE
mgnify:CR=1 FL=1